MKRRITTTWAINVLVIAAIVGGSTGRNASCVRAQAASVLSVDSGNLGDQLANFPVEFTDCVESIGVTLVPTTSARVYVPDQFILVGQGQPVTPLVVRTSRCGGIAVDGHRARPGEIVQIGAVIVPPDLTGDINNYTIWYYTSDARLALRLLLAGVSAQYVPTIDYDYHTADSPFDVRVPLPGIPRLTLSGIVDPSLQPAGTFLANWWQAASGRRVKMTTNVPVINIGGADLLLTTNQHGPLGQLIGGSSTGFPIIQQFNTFGAAHLQVSSVLP